MASESIPVLPGGYPETPSPYGGLPSSGAPPVGPFSPSGPVGPDGAAVAAAGAGAPTGQAAQGAATKADSSLSNATAKPCAKCKQTDFSIAFRVKDSKGNLCKQMYYTVYYASQGGQTGTTNDDGLTERYYGNENEKIMLYLGHRDNIDKDHPEEPSSDEDKYDEASLAHDTFGDVADKKIADAKTARLWKPWTYSADTKKKSIDDWEKRKPHVYDDRYPNQDWNGTHTKGERLTIGAGHYMPGHAEADGYYNEYPPDGPGMPNSEMDSLYDSDVKTKADSAGANDAIKVPLYQREFDALIDLRFNGGSGSSDYHSGWDTAAPHDHFKGHKSVEDLLNAGRYKQAGERMQTTANAAGGTWSKGVQRRKNWDSDVFSGN